MAKLGERVIESLGGVTRADLDQVRESRYLEGYADGYNDGGEDEPPSGTTKTQGYRSSGAHTRDGKVDYNKALSSAWLVYTSNPIAKRALHIKRDYILGRGVQIQAGDEDLQAILDDFWAVNRLRRRIKEFTLQLFLFGSQCYPVFVRETDGRVRLGYIDPAQIAAVITDPENAMEMWAVVVKAQTSSSGWVDDQDKRVYRIVREQEPATPKEGEEAPPTDLTGKLVTAEQATLEDWEAPMLDAHGLKEYTGTCFYEKVNSVSNQPLGYSDLLQVMDWLDQHDETLFALGEREQFAGYFSWEVTLASQDAAEVKKRAGELRKNPPKRGSVNVHNDAETWNFHWPDLKQNGSVETAEAIETHALGGLGLPRHWYGHGDETNRATAQAQGDPTWRSLEHDQDVIRDLITQMLTFARDQAEIAGYWSAPKKAGKEDEQAVDAAEITVQMPEMTAKDVVRIAQAAQALASALLVAEQSGWMPPEAAQEAWASVMGEMGVEYDLGEMEAQAEEQAEDGAEELPEEAQEYARLFAPVVAS